MNERQKRYCVWLRGAELQVCVAVTLWSKCKFCLALSCTPMEQTSWSIWKPISPDSWSMHTRCKHKGSKGYKKAHIQPCTHTQPAVTCCMSTRIKTDILNNILVHKYIQNQKKNKSVIGTALHFVPGYISVGSIGFPELQLHISRPPDSPTLDLLQQTQRLYKRNLKRGVW